MTGVAFRPSSSSPSLDWVLTTPTFLSPVVSDTDGVLKRGFLVQDLMFSELYKTVSSVSFDVVSVLPEDSEELRLRDETARRVTGDTTTSTKGTYFNEINSFYSFSHDD